MTTPADVSTPISSCFFPFKRTSAFLVTGGRAAVTSSLPLPPFRQLKFLLLPNFVAANRSASCHFFSFPFLVNGTKQKKQKNQLLLLLLLCVLPASYFGSRVFFSAGMDAQLWWPKKFLLLFGISLLIFFFFFFRVSVRRLVRDLNV